MIKKIFYLCSAFDRGNLIEKTVKKDLNLILQF